MGPTAREVLVPCCLSCRSSGRLVAKEPANLKPGSQQGSAQQGSRKLKGTQMFTVWDTGPEGDNK